MSETERDSPNQPNKLNLFKFYESTIDKTDINRLIGRFLIKCDELISTKIQKSNPHGF